MNGIKAERTDTRSVSGRRLLLSGLLLTLLAHYGWEMAQARFFANFSGLSVLRHALPCFLASLGDVAIAALAYGAAALTFRRPFWALERNWLSPALLWIAIGMIVTVRVERLAVTNGWWDYEPTMITIFGIGLAPLLQWLLIPTLTLVTLRGWARR